MADQMLDVYPAEGEYVCPVCTVFGLDKEEVKVLLEVGLQITDHNRDEEGYEVRNSAFKVMRELGRMLGFSPIGGPARSETPSGRTGLIWTLTKDVTE